MSQTTKSTEETRQINYQAILDALSTPICMTNAENKVIFLNQAAAHLIGRDAKECVGVACDLLQDQIGLRCDEKGISFFENGNRFYQVENIPYPNKESKFTIRVACDVTELRKEKELIGFYTIRAPIGIFQVKMEEGLPLFYANDAFYVLHGYTKVQMEEELGNQIQNYITPEKREKVYEELTAAMQKGQSQISFETSTLKRDGTLLWVTVFGNFLLLDGEEIFCGYEVDSTPSKRAQEEIRISEERYRIALSLTKSCIWDYDIASQTLYPTDGSLRKYGFTQTCLENVPETLVKREVIHPDFATDFCRMFEQMREGERITTWTGKMRDASGEYAWTKITHTSIYDDDGSPIKAIGISEDVSEVKNAQLRYLQEQQYREILTADAIASYEVNITKDKPIAGNLDEDAKTGIKISSYTELIFAGSQKVLYAEERRDFIERLGRSTLLADYENGIHTVRLEYHSQTENGVIYWACVVVNMIKDKNSGDICGFIYIKNVDEKKKWELALEEKAERDAVTGLYNRATVQSLINEILSASPQPQGALLVIDTDCFRQINDSFGAVYGDSVLSDLASKLKESFRPNDVLGRMGGDEFVAFLKDIPSEKFVNQRAIQICREIRRVYFSADQKYEISASIGIVFLGKERTDFQSLYEKATAALYRAKSLGKGRYVVYEGNNAMVREIVPSKEAMASNQRQILEESEEMVAVCDFVNYDMLYLNRAARESFHFTGEEYLGKKCYKLLYGEDNPCPFCNRQSIRYDTFRVQEHLDPEIHRRLIVRDKLINWEGKKAQIEYAIDIANSSYVSHMLSDKIEIENILLSCISSLFSTECLNSAMTLVLQNIGNYYGADRAYVLEIDNVENVTNMLYEWCRESVVAQLEFLQKVPLDYFPRWIENFQKNIPVILNDLEEIKESSPEEYAILKVQDIDALYAIPFSVKGVLVGYIGIDNPTTHLGNIALLDSLAYFIMNEILKRKMLKTQEFLSYHDALTGLCDRNGYLRYLDEVNESTLSSIGVMVADINGLKQINEDFGHEYGDTVVRQIADILRHYFHEKQIFRFGGDEFIVLCEDITRSRFVALVQEAQAELNKKSSNGVCIGQTWSDLDINIETLINHADELMMITKQEYYRNSQDAGRHYRPHILDNLLESLKESRFIMYLQPKAEISSGKIVGAEALVRYIDPQHGVIPPGKFIPILEKEKLVRYIDFFIFEEVCKTLQLWKTQGRHLACVSLNFSRVTILEPDLIEHMLSIHGKYGFPREWIEIEITESIGEMERETIAEIGLGIQKQGFSVSLDDFGSKYTSMSILSIMKFNVLKLDRSLVNDLVSSEKSQVVVKCVLEMCRGLGVRCVAEGVETMEQIMILQKLGCDFVQGYLLSKPLPLAAFEAKYFERKEEMAKL